MERKRKEKKQAKQPASAPDRTDVEVAGPHPLPTSSAEVSSTPDQEVPCTPDSALPHPPKQGVHSSPEWEVSEQPVPHTPEPEDPHTSEREDPHEPQVPHLPEHEVTPPTGVEFEEVFMVSALTGDGVDDLRVIHH